MAFAFKSFISEECRNNDTCYCGIVTVSEYFDMEYIHGQFIKFYKDIEKCNKGEANTIYMVARSHFIGYPKNFNETLACEMMEKCGEMNHSACLLDFAICLLNRNQSEKALKIFHKAADRGEFHSFSWLAWYYITGFVVEQNYSLAKEYAMKGLRGIGYGLYGDPSCATDLAWLLWITNNDTEHRPHMMAYLMLSRFIPSRGDGYVGMDLYNSVRETLCDQEFNTAIEVFEHLRKEIYPLYTGDHYDLLRYTLLCNEKYVTNF